MDADVPRRGQVHIVRSLSLQEITCMGYDTWKAKASSGSAIPLVAPSPRGTRRLLLSTSLPEKTDAILSKSVLEQCRLDDQAPDASPRSSLNHCGSWMSRMLVEVASGSTCKTSRSRAWKNWGFSLGLAPCPPHPDRPHNSNNNNNHHHHHHHQRHHSSHESPAGPETRFTKRQNSHHRPKTHVSALSTALHDSTTPRQDQNQIMDPVEFCWMQNCISCQHKYLGQKITEHSTGLEKQVNVRTTEQKTAESVTGAGEPRSLPVSIPPRRHAPPYNSSTDLSSEMSWAGSLALSTTTDTSSSSASSSSSSSFSSSSSGSLPSLPTAHEEQKRLLLDRLMGHFLGVFASSPTSLAGGSSKSTTSPSSYSSSPGEHENAARVPRQDPRRKSRTTGGGGKRSHTDQDNNGDGDESDGEEEARRPRTKRSKSGENGTRMLACPFFKHNPHRYKEKRSCVGPGWKDVHRLKEHIYRNHQLPIYCLRCHEVFTNEELLLAHSQSKTSCQLRSSVDDSSSSVFEGIGLSQERDLRKRKRVNKTEEEKWRDVYMICFPDATTIPCAYYEIPTLFSESPIEGYSSELARYKSFARKELPRRLHRELMLRIERDLAPIEEKIKRQMTDIFEGIQMKLIEDFKKADCRESFTTPPVSGGGSRDDEEGEDGVGGEETEKERRSDQEMLYGSDIQDGGGEVVAMGDKGNGRETTIMGMSDEGRFVDMPVLDNAWVMSHPMDVCMPSYPYLVDDSLDLVVDATQEGEDWPSSWTNGGYNSWM